MSRLSESDEKAIREIVEHQWRPFLGELDMVLAELDATRTERDAARKALEIAKRAMRYGCMDQIRITLSEIDKPGETK